MKVGVMITNGGPHPPEKWADQTANKLTEVLQIESSYPGYESALQAKNVLRDQLRDALTTHHADVQGRARQRIAAVDSVVAAPPDPTEHLDGALSAVNALLGKSMFKEHYAKPEVQQFVRSTIASHFATAIHIEHSWHADRNPSSPSAAAFRAQHHQGA